MTFRETGVSGHELSPLIVWYIATEVEPKTFIVRSSLVDRICGNMIV